jgi:hypothetical protein
MPSLYAQKKSGGLDPQRGRSSRKKERNVPLLTAFMNQNMKLCYTQNEYLVPLKNEMGQVRGASTSVRLKIGATLEDP